MQNKNLQMKRALRTALLVLLLTVVGLGKAQVSTWDGTWEPWIHGTGTEVDPFLIENAQQLAYLAYRVNNGLDSGGGHVSNHDFHYKLMLTLMVVRISNGHRLGIGILTRIINVLVDISMEIIMSSQTCIYLAMQIESVFLDL